MSAKQVSGSHAPMTSDEKASKSPPAPDHVALESDGLAALGVVCPGDPRTEGKTPGGVPSGARATEAADRHAEATTSEEAMIAEGDPNADD